MSSPALSFEELLRASLLSADQGGKLSVPQFIRSWFFEGGGAWFFLFKKNIKVTNIQFGELFALLRTFTKLSDGEPVRDLQFLSAMRAAQVLKELDKAFRKGIENASEQRADLIVDLYAELLRHTAIVDCYHGSCSVYLPPSLSLNIVSLCGLSGYVHSCGRLVYSEAANVTRPDQFIQAVDSHLSSHPSERSVFFSVYAHEDFTKFDREYESELRDGLDDVKIYVEKFYMGQLRLVQVLAQMRERFGERLFIPDPGNYNVKHKQLREGDDIEPSRTLWLISDRPIIERAQHSVERILIADDERYFICYDQLLTNENPFHIFDENKPAWKAHTTIPHTLVGAMINLSRPWWPREHKAIICDPFVGTGTSCMEVMKFEEAEAKGSDLDYSAPLLFEDNLHFFSCPQEELELYVKAMQAITKGDKGQEEFIDPRTQTNPVMDGHSVASAFDWATRTVHELRDSHPGDFEDLPRELVEVLHKRHRFERLFFYVARRALIRHLAAFERDPDDWVAAFCKERAVLARQFTDLKNAGKRLEDSAKDRSRPIVRYQGSYSDACGINPDFLRSAANPDTIRSIVQVQNADDLPPGVYDVIVADPPYGFNTEENPEDLARLYSRILDSMIGALKNEGQLVICLLDRSHTGRQSLFFTNKEVVIHQVLVKAEAAGFEVIMPTGRVPEPASLYRPPYYWESIRALRRSILHFRLRRRGLPETVTGADSARQ